ncbi:MAG: putative HNHc nuclease [Acetivibrio ethanolgignens]
MYELGYIKKYAVDETGTSLVVHIPNRNYQEAIESKQMRTCGLWLEDGRSITAEQRKKAYATIGDIANYTGYAPEDMKQELKIQYYIRTGRPEFSFSDCSISTAREFINTMLDIAIENGIILSDAGIDRTDDIGRYLYTCLVHRKCAVCGCNGEIHHWDAIGMGNDRRHYDDRNLRKICLCRKHHTECHQIGREAFEKKYKVYGIVAPL